MPEPGDGPAIEESEEVGCVAQPSLEADSVVVATKKKWPTLKKPPTHEHKKNSKFYNNDFCTFATEVLQVLNISDSACTPNSYNEAIASPEAAEWIKAMQAEYSALDHNSTFKLALLPVGLCAIGLRWLYKIKRKASGVINCLKVRWVGKGYAQRLGIDYNKTFSLVVMMEHLQQLLTLTAILNLKVKVGEHSVAIRTSGFNSVDITKLSVASLWLFTGMMYIAASPVAITLRYTSRANDSLVATGRTAKTTNTVGSQAQTLFMRHFIFLFVGVLFICMIEEVPLRIDPNWSIFKIIFEVVSGYGTVGLTLGYGSLPYSFCGVWKDGSKMVLLFIMIRRNLPESVDSAVSVPSYASNDDDDSLSDIEVLSDDDDDDAAVSLEELDNPGSSEDDKKHKRLRGAGVTTTTDTEGDETQLGLVLSTDTEGDAGGR